MLIELNCLEFFCYAKLEMLNISRGIVLYLLGLFEILKQMPVSTLLGKVFFILLGQYPY